jgi:hypothetical protein
MSASQRRKGAGGEREVCALLHGEFGIVAARELGQARDSGCDIRVRPFAIEVKRRSLSGLHGWMRQAQIAARDDETPVVMVRADGEQWLVIMRFEDWARLAREEIACGGNDSPTTLSAPATGGSPSSPSVTDADLPSTTTAP